MRHRIWSGKYGAGLSVLSLTVAEEKRICSRVIVPESAGLTDKATREGHSILHTRSTGNYEIITYDIDSHMHRSMYIAVYAAVLES
jgi:hypothetical protein